MKNIIKAISLVLICGLIMVCQSGCKKFLDETDPSNFTMDNYFTKPAQAQSAINAIYQSLVSIPTGDYGGAPWMMLEFPTGLANTEYGQSVDNLNIRNLVNTADNNHCSQKWTTSYRGIGNANLAIAKIPGITMDEALKKKELGEAYFLRAFYYFDLVRIFGRIPLITKPVDSKSPDIYSPQASLDDIYNQIISDLTNAENSGLPYIDISGRATVGAAKSLLASVYLTMAGYPLQKGAEYYKKAADKANEVITSGQYSLFTSYDDLHSLTKQNTGENIFMVQFAAATWTTSTDFQKFILPYTKDISLLNNRTGAIYSTNEFIGSFEAGDKRVQDRQFFYTTYTLSHDRNTTVS
ncbi:MAG TPA: RagB/SusD family nutrient uptake outer membrane protein, partial [Pedobacter sp.]